MGNWRKLLLTTDFDESLYALLAGRNGGQTLKGGSGASEHLTLQSTAHATRGYVRAQDDLQLLSNILRDAAGTNRLQLAAASPHLLLTGNPQIDGYLGIGTAPTAGMLLDVEKIETAVTNLYGAYIQPTQQTSGGSCIGVSGMAFDSGATYKSVTRGLVFSAGHGSAGTITAVQGVYSDVTTLSGAGAVGYLTGLYVWAILAANVNVAQSDGLWIRNFGKAPVAVGSGIRVDDQLYSVAPYIAWFGNSSPKVRIDGGNYSVAGKTPLCLDVAGTLYRVTRNAVTGALETALP